MKNEAQQTTADATQKIVEDIVNEVVERVGNCPTILDLEKIVEAENSDSVSRDVAELREYFLHHREDSGGCSRCEKTLELLAASKKRDREAVA